jgi:undecaprenyl pyrophosphate phosphatase UppP
VAGVLFADAVKSRLYDTGSGTPALGVIAIAFIVGGVVMLLVERFRASPDVREADQTPDWAGPGHRRCQGGGHDPGVSRRGRRLSAGS